MITKIVSAIVAAAIALAFTAQASAKPVADITIKNARCGILKLDKMNLGHIESHRQANERRANLDERMSYLSSTHTTANYNEYLKIATKNLDVYEAVRDIELYRRALVKNGNSEINAINKYYRMKDDVLAQRNLIRELEISKC